MNPVRIWSVFDITLRGFLRDKGGLFFTFLFPIMLILLFGFIFSETDEVEYPLHIQDLDGTDMSVNLTGMLKGISSFDVKMISPDRDLDTYLKDNDINFVLVIPEGYQDSLIDRMKGDRNSTVNLTVKYDPSRSSTQVKLAILNGVLQEMNNGIEGVEDTIVLKAESIFTEDFEYIDFFIPGVLGMTVMTGAVFGTIFGDSEM